MTTQRVPQRKVGSIDIDAFVPVAAEAPVLAGEAGGRAAAALRLRRVTGEFDVEDARSHFAALLTCDGAMGARKAS